MNYSYLAVHVTTCFFFFTSQAVNKLAEIMNRKEFSQKQNKKASSADLKKKEKECRRLQQELTLVRIYLQQFSKDVDCFPHLNPGHMGNG